MRRRGSATRARSKISNEALQGFCDARALKQFKRTALGVLLSVRLEHPGQPPPCYACWLTWSSTFLKKATGRSGRSVHRLEAEEGHPPGCQLQLSSSHGKFDRQIASPGGPEWWTTYMPPRQAIKLIKNATQPWDVNHLREGKS